MIGTAVAFLISFQNNAAYGRIWEARKIWGGIVNTSRTFGMFVQDMVNNEYAKDPLSQEEIDTEKPAGHPFRAQVIGDDRGDGDTP